MMRTIINGPYTVACDDPFEVWRAETLFTKEPGTLRWLAGLQPGETFYDIGANIGIYSLVAAQHVGPTGFVVAFEPHIPNAAALLRNLAGAGAQTRVLTCALHCTTGVFPFQYACLRPGSSGSQFGHHTSEHGEPFIPHATELKCGVTLDQLLWDGVLTPAHLVKIDVDGNELKILRGMATWLSADSAPRSVQIEVRPCDRFLIVEFMREHGYQVVHVHYTANGQLQITRGKSRDDVVSNTVFEKS
jgi:FkbM family methyltransferase